MEDRIISADGRKMVVITYDDDPLNPWDEYGTRSRLVYWSRRWSLTGDRVHPDEFALPGDQWAFPVDIADDGELHIFRDEVDPGRPYGESEGVMLISKAEVGDDREYAFGICRDELREYNAYVMGDVYRLALYKVPYDKDAESVELCDCEMEEESCGYYTHDWARRAAEDWIAGIDNGDELVD